MRHGAILSAVYSVRIKAVEALLAAAGRHVANAAELRSHAATFDELTTRYADANIAMAYSAFADLLRTVAMLVDWRAAVLDAAIDSVRFLRSAQERHRQWSQDFSQRDEVAALAQVAHRIETVVDIAEVGPLCEAIGMTPLPIGIFADEQERRRLRIPDFDSDGEHTRQPPPQLAVAFLRFNVDGAAANQTDFLTPQEAHDLEIEVRVSRWPEGAEALRLAPVSIETHASYSFPEFRFGRPTGQPPYHLKERGRAVLHVAQALRAQPFEFRYAAEFEPITAEQPVAVVGHRTLRIESIDLQRAPLTGYQGIDRRIIEIRNELRQHPLVIREDVDNTLTLLAALGNLAGQAAQDARFPEPLDERSFQKSIREDLRRRSEIGAKLEEHPRAAGGATDLSFERIRIELKSENDRPLRLADCQKFVNQAASYAAGTGKRVAMLCVLDGSAKAEPAFPPEDGIGILKTQDGAVAIVTVLLQGNLARPSDLSRARSSRRSKAGHTKGRTASAKSVAEPAKRSAAAADLPHNPRAARPGLASVPDAISNGPTRWPPI